MHAQDDETKLKRDGPYTPELKVSSLKTRATVYSAVSSQPENG